MDDATQKLVDEARGLVNCRAPMGGNSEDSLIEALADALEAAQRPPVSPEAQATLIRVLLAEGVGTDMGDRIRIADGIIARLTVPLPPVGPEQQEALIDLIEDWGIDNELDAGGMMRADLADALLARFTFPSLDPEKVARWLYLFPAADGFDSDLSAEEADRIAVALIAALPLLTKEGGA